MNSERMKKVYYNCEITNQTTDNVDAKYSVSLLKPIIDNPLQYNINVNRFRLPLNGVPLSKKNIPFQQWQLGLTYTSDSALSVQAAYVPQVNPKTQDVPANYCVASYVQNGQSVLYLTDTNNIQYVNSDIPLISQNNYQNFAYDFSGNFYALTAGANYVNVYNSSTGEHTSTIDLTVSVNAITVNPFNGDLYTAFNNNGDGMNIQIYRDGSFLNNIEVQTAGTIAGSISLAYCNGWVYYINTTTSDTIFYVKADFSTQSSYTFPDGIIVQGACSPNGSGSFWVNKVSNGCYIVQYNVDSNTGAITQATTFRVADGGYYGGYGAFVIGQDNSGNILYYTSQDYVLKAYSPKTNSIVYSTNQFTNPSPPKFPQLAFPAGNITVPVDSGDVDIESYQTFLTQINLAFEQAFTNLSQISGYEPTQPPRVIYNPQTKLFSIVCQGFYLETIDGEPKYKIFMNPSLWNMFLFPSVLSAGYRYMIVENDIYNVTYTSGATTPSYVTVNQEASTIFKFYDLVRILVVTSKIPVNGDVEGTNTSVNLITDIVPDTSTLTPDSIIVYQPTVLRNYNLESNVPLRDLDIQFYYGSKDGTIHRVELLPNEYASIKLEFEQVVSGQSF